MAKTTDDDCDVKCPACKKRCHLLWDHEKIEKVDHECDNMHSWH